MFLKDHSHRWSFRLVLRWPNLAKCVWRFGFWGQGERFYHIHIFFWWFFQWCDYIAPQSSQTKIVKATNRNDFIISHTKSNKHRKFWLGWRYFLLSPGRSKSHCFLSFRRSSIWTCPVGSTKCDKWPGEDLVGRTWHVFKVLLRSVGHVEKHVFNNKK